MTKIHNLSSNSFSLISPERELYTLWMKSLVFNGNGCTVFDSKGDIIFRVDNYQRRHSRRVFLMDSNGTVLFSICRKRLWIFECWEGFKWADDTKAKKEMNSWFRVKRNQRTFFGTDLSCKVTLKCDENIISMYKIIGSRTKCTLKIMEDLSGHLLAEVVQKLSSSEVSLGDDVLTLMVEPDADRALVMALVVAYGLINNKL